MRNELMLTSLAAAGFWVIGAFCGIAFAGALPVWDYQSVAPATLNDGRAIADANARLNTLLTEGWEVERVVPTQAGQINEPTYILRKPFWR